MPKNHLICQAYLRGFADGDDNLEKRTPDGTVTLAKTHDVCYEDTPAEPSIERIRKDQEQFWGDFRSKIRTDLYSKGNRGQQSKVAEFIATTIMLCKVGRKVVRARPKRADYFGSEKEFEALAVAVMAKKLAKEFLALHWMIVKPLFPLITGDSPASWKMCSDDPNKIVGMFFPMTTTFLLCLSDRDENEGYQECSPDEIAKRELSFASNCGIACNLDLMKGASEQGTNLYAPVGYNWTGMFQLQAEHEKGS